MSQSTIMSSEPVSNPVSSNKRKTRENKVYVPLIPIAKAIEAGVHIGMRSNKWNPKMVHYIYAKKVHHIFDLKRSMILLEKACNYLRDIAKAGGEIIFVGTKNKHTKEIVKSAAQRVGVYYLTERWLGGLVTNFRNISHSINKLIELETQLADDQSDKNYTKKELTLLTKEKNKLDKFYGGVKNMKTLPQVLVCFDPVEDINAIKEAKIKNISIVALANSNADPDLVDFIIPCNNATSRSVYLIANALADAIALSNEQDTLILGKSSDQITLPELVKKTNISKRPVRGEYSRSNFRTKFNPSPSSSPSSVG